MRLAISMRATEATSKSEEEGETSGKRVMMRLQSEKDANEERDVMGRIVCVDNDDADRSLSASSPNAIRNSGLATSSAVRL